MRLLPERANHDCESSAGQKSAPTDAQIRAGMNTTLCRCMTYYRIQAAIKRAAKVIADVRPSAEKEVIA